MYARLGLDKRRARLTLAALAATLAAAIAAAPASAAPGDYSQAQINQAIENGVGWIDAQQNPDGSFGGIAFPEAETALAIISYGVLDGGDSSKLTATQRSHLQAAVTWLLGKQQSDGSWGESSPYLQHRAGAAGLLLRGRPVAGHPGGRREGALLPPAQPAGPDLGDRQHRCPGRPRSVARLLARPWQPLGDYCGGWTTDSRRRARTSRIPALRSPASPPAAASRRRSRVNAGWQRNVQQLTCNGSRDTERRRRLLRRRAPTAATSPPTPTTRGR